MGLLTLNGTCNSTLDEMRSTAPNLAKDDLC